MKKRFTIFLSFSILILVMAILFAMTVDKQHLLNILVQKSTLIKSQVDEWPMLSVSLFMTFYAALVVISIPGVFLLTIIGGATFGWLGLLYTAIAATLGSTVAFYLSRYWFREAVLSRRKRRLRQFNFLINKHGISILIALRLFTLIPYYIVNLVSGLTNVSPTRFFFTTLIGMLPVHGVFINAGTHIAEIDQISDIWNPELIVAFALLALLPIMAIFFKKAVLTSQESP